MQVPACGVVPNGSCDVLLITNPESNPAWLVRNGNNRSVAQATILAVLIALLVSAKRGTGALTEAVVTVLNGAKLPLVVMVPMPGRFEPGLAVKAAEIAKYMVSKFSGLLSMTSQTAVALPLAMGSGAIPPSDVLVAEAGEKPPFP